jgi:hypothetical protein
VGLFRFGLMGSAPERPGDDAGRLDAPLREPVGDTADFLDGPSDQRRRSAVKIPSFVCLADAVLARCRIAAIMERTFIVSDKRSLMRRRA